MTIVSDTSPIAYLLLIGNIEVLPQLFGRVAIPVEVQRELADPAAPLTIREWIAGAAELAYRSFRAGQAVGERSPGS